MPTKRHSAEQIVRKLREAEVELARGATVKDACRKLAITEHTYYRWAYARSYRNSARRTRALRPGLNEYNHHRPHGSIGKKPPISRLSEYREQPV